MPAVKQAAILYATLTIALAWPLSAHLSTTVFSDGPDTNLYLWTLAWDTHALVRHPLSMFDANIYFPRPHTLAYSENLIGSALFAAPVIWLTGNLVLAMNLLVMFGSILCGLGAYLLARKAGVTDRGALIAGVVFAFSPPRFLRLDQLHLATIQWVAFGLAYLHAYLDDGRPRDVRLFLGFLTLQALTSGHGAVFLLLAAAVVVAYRVMLGEPLMLPRRAGDVGVVGALAIAPAAVLMIPYWQVQRDVGLRRSLEGWTVSPESFFASPSHAHQWLLGLFHATRVNAAADAYLFPGFVPLALALAGLVGGVVALRRRAPAGDWRGAVRRSAALTYTLVALVSLLMAVGPRFSLWPLVYWLPGFNFIRAPSRFMLLALLGVAIVAGVGFDRLTRRARGQRWMFTAIVIALLVAEFAAMPFALTKKRVDIQPIDRWLAAQPGVRAIAEVPLVDPRHLQASEMRHTDYMLHATSHWRKTVEGYSGIRPPSFERLYAELLQFPDETSLRSLTDLGVSHVIVHTDLYDPAEWALVETRLREFSALLRLEQIAGPGRIYALQGAPNQPTGR